MTRLHQLEELAVFVEKCLDKNQFKENNLCLFLADFNVDAKGEKYPMNFVSSFNEKNVNENNFNKISFLKAFKHKRRFL